MAGLKACKSERSLRRKASSPENLGEGGISEESNSTYHNAFCEPVLQNLQARQSGESSKSPTIPTPEANKVLQAFWESEASEYISVQEFELPELENQNLQEIQQEILDAFPWPHDTGIHDSHAIDEISLSTYMSTSSLEDRLSKRSSRYLKAIARLKKTHSISNSSAATSIGGAYSISVNATEVSSTDSGTIRNSTSTAKIPYRSQVAKSVFPDAALILDRYLERQGFCQEGLQSHDSRSCWCLQDLDPNTQLWVHRIDPAARTELSILNLPDFVRPLHFRDAFGNSLLHRLAARGADMFEIFNALKRGVDGNLKNSAGQTFLHVLSQPLLKSLAEGHGLMYIFGELDYYKVKYREGDHFGRTFLHLLTRKARTERPEALDDLVWLNIDLPRARDSFGWVATYSPNLRPKVYGNSRTYSRKIRVHEQGSPHKMRYHREQVQDHSTTLTTLVTIQEDGSQVETSLSPLNNQTQTEEDCFLLKHARLLETASLSLNLPSIEDSEGRNGLQCLAEASLALSIDNKEVSAKAFNKRKRDKPDPEFLSGRLQLRFEFAQKLIAGGVDVNNYDKHGNTVLMAFVTYLPDGEDDELLAKILQLLVHNGANVHLRNRQGETALHVSVRLGHKVATHVLLKNGANLHARTSEGKGVLALGEMHYFRTEDQWLYASIMACMALCLHHGAVPWPSFVDEWIMRDEILPIGNAK